MNTLPLHDLNALVVEDDAILASVFDEMLRDLGCRNISHASSVDAAFEALENERPDFVLLDARLRGASAAPVAEALREDGIPVVVTTGYSRDALPAALAAEPLLHKPFRAEALATRVREARTAGLPRQATETALIGEPL